MEGLVCSSDHKHTQLDSVARLVVLAVGTFANAIEDLAEEHGGADFLVTHQPAGATGGQDLVDWWAPAVLPVQAEHLLHPGLLLVNEPVDPEIAVQIDARPAGVGHLELRGWQAQGFAQSNDVCSHGGKVVHLGDGGQLAQIAADVSGQPVDYDELTQQRVEDRAKVLGLESGCTLLGRVDEK